jgi:hypothetical protein
VFPHKILNLVAALVLVSPIAAQQPSALSQTPPVKVSVLNVCAPPADQQKELSSALAKVPGKPAFSKDFEVARGHSTLDQSTPIPGMEQLPAGAVSSADWVRVRREFPDATLFSTVQYSFSTDAKDMVETLVLRVRDPKDLIEISIEDSASTVTSAAAMLSASTPVSRIKLERFGKSSVVLARCGGESPGGQSAVDQSAYEPIFHAASSIMERYRAALDAPRTVPQELSHLGVGKATTRTAKPAASGKKAP